MSARFVSLAGAVLASALLLSGCSSDPAPNTTTPDASSTETASANETSEAPAPTPTADDKASCELVFGNGGDEEIAMKVPGMLIDMPAELTLSTLQPYLEVNEGLEAAIEISSPELQDAYKKIQIPFKEISDIVSAGGGELNADSSQVAQGITDAMVLCTAAGHRVNR